MDGVEGQFNFSYLMIWESEDKVKIWAIFCFLSQLEAFYITIIWVSVSS